MKKETRPSWDDTFMEICDVLSKRSKDPSTKLGCVIIGEHREILTTGYNCFPRGIDDNNPERYITPLKYKWIEHAERNAIYNAIRCNTALMNSCLYCNWIPCTDCCRAIIQSGIKEIVAKDLSVPDRWVSDFRQSCIMLSEAGIKLRKPNSEENILSEILKYLEEKEITLNK